MEKAAKISNLKRKKSQNVDFFTEKPKQNFSFSDIKNVVKNLSDLGYSDIDILIYLAEQFKDKEKILKILKDLRLAGEF
jgi:hypothetical protein